MVKQAFKKSKTDELFTLVKNEKNKVVIVVGNIQVVEEEFRNFQEAENYIASKPYKLIFNTFQIIMNYAQKQKENAAENEKNAASN